MTINALFVETNGVYFDIPGVIPWDIERNAFNCNNGAPAIAHPPCERWGRYWNGGPSVKIKKKLGDDGGCFWFALWYVRTYGGIIEHPEGTHAYKWFGINRPKRGQCWIEADSYGGLVCSVDQGNYGHKARKATWLYINKVKPFDLDWKKAEGKMRIEDSPRSKEAALKMRSDPNYQPIKRLSKQERVDTPILFRDVLLEAIIMN